MQVVGAIFVDKGKVFAAKRGKSRYPYVAHKYEFAGGKVEAGEDLTQAIKREIREELALDITVVRPYMSVHHIYPDFEITLHTFLCQMKGEYTLLEHEEGRWIALEDLVSDEWAPADKTIIEALRLDQTLRG